MAQPKITFTMTAGDVSENHVHMQQIGELVAKGQGFNLDDLKQTIKFCDEKGIKSELYNLNDY